MPIKGVSEIVRLPRLGKIRMGTREERDDVTYLIPADHFICPDEVKKVFGDKPKELRIMFPTENREQCPPSVSPSTGISAAKKYILRKKSARRQRG